jgi:hypothetical protein
MFIIDLPVFCGQRSYPLMHPFIEIPRWGKMGASWLLSLFIHGLCLSLSMGCVPLYPWVVSLFIHGLYLS